jgi:beta-glucosidase
MGGQAIAEILFGIVNPSGKLPVTFEKKWEDNPTFNSYYDVNKTMRVNYSEGIFVGYRGYDKNNIEPLFPFGFGMSYTTFEYKNFVLNTKIINGTGMIEASVEIKNTGDREGKEIIQLYISDHHASLPRPLKELKHFTKIDLKPGETRKVVFKISGDDLKYYNPGKGGWIAEPGVFEAQVGSSSKDIKLKESFTLVK